MELKEIVNKSKFNLSNVLNRLLLSSSYISRAIFSKLLESSDNSTKSILSNSLLSGFSNISLQKFSSEFEKEFLYKVSESSILHNNDLVKSVRKAIILFFERESQNKEYGIERQMLKQLAKISLEEWDALIKVENSNHNIFSPLKNEEINELLPNNLSDYFSPASETSSKATFLSIESWNEIIKLLAKSSAFFLRPQVIDKLSLKLFNEFPELFRKVLIDDLTENPKAYSEIQFLLLKEIASVNKETLQLTQQINKNLDEIISVVSNIQKQTPKFISSRSFPSPPTWFFGRKDILKNLEYSLKQANRATLIGLKGIGKTTLALQYAYQNAENYNNIFYLRANRYVFPQELARCADRVSVFSYSDTTELEKAFKFIDWLNKQDNFLLIIDNIDSPSEIYPFTSKIRNGHIVFISNNPETSTLGNEVKIKTLPTEEAELFLYQSATGNINISYKEISPENREAIGKIINEIDSLPLAINLVGAYIRRYKKTFEEYLELYKTSAEKLFNRQDVMSQYEHNSVVQTFSLAFEEIASTEDDKAESKQIAETAVLFLKTASFLYHEAIPLEIFTEMLVRQNNHGIRLSQDEFFLDEVFAKIQQFSLFEKDADKNTINIHRLVQRIINNKINEDEKRSLCEQILEILANLIPLYDYSNQEIFERYFYQAQVALENAEKLSLESEYSKILYNRLGHFQYLFGNYDLAEKFHLQNWRTSENFYGKNHQETAQALNQLALVYKAQGRYDEAIEKFEIALEIGEKTIGKEHPSYSTRLNNLANVYRSLGRYEKAIEILMEALAIDAKIIGKTHPNYAISLNNLANTYQLLGRYPEAIEKYKEALAIDAKTIGKEHPDYATHLNNLAMVFKSQGKYSEAIKKFEEALFIAEKTIGKEHPDYATRLNNLGEVYLSQSRYDESVEKFEEALAIDAKTIGKEHPQYANHLNNLASAYRLQERFDEAMPLFEEALRIFVKVLGENHPSTQKVKGNLEDCRKLAKGE